MAKVIISGAGLVGSLLSIYLARRGMDVKVIEKRPDPRKASLDGGKSINLAISVRGISALKELGLEEKVMKHAIPMTGRMVHSLKGDTFSLPYGRTKEEHINSLSRGLLNKILLSELSQYKNVSFEFETETLGYNFSSQKIKLPGRELDADLVIGTDGAASNLRWDMIRQPRGSYSQQFESHGYKELTLYPKNGKPQLELNYLHIWPRESFMLIALPNPDGTFTCTLFLSLEGEVSFEKLKTENELTSFFERYFPDLFPKFSDLNEQFFHNPTGNLGTIKMFPWVYKDKLCLMGDAAHAVVPFYGQGMNCGFEDCEVFNKLLDEHHDFSKVLPKFQALRKPNADAIADMARENFIEMRDLVDNEKFKLKKKFESELMAVYPEYISKYVLVTFTKQPYSYAKKCGEIQNVMLEEFCHVNSIHDLPKKEVDQWMKRYLEKIN